MRTLTACLLILFSFSFLHGQPANNSPVQVTATATTPDADGKQKVAIVLTIKEPYYLYANPVDNEDLVDAETRITISAKEAVKDVRLTFPHGKRVRIELHGGDLSYRRYEAKAVIRATLVRTNGDRSPLDVAVHYKLGHPRRCYPLTTLKVQSPARRP